MPILCKIGKVGLLPSSTLNSLKYNTLKSGSEIAWGSEGWGVQRLWFDFLIFLLYLYLLVSDFFK